MTNKISNTFIFLLIVVFFFSTKSLQAQNDYTVPSHVSDIQRLRELISADSNKKMVELKTLIPTLVYDLRYASKNNFMKRKMYAPNTTITFLRLPAARALKNVQDELREKGLGLKIFDAYRPYSVTVRFWELVRDERYVANPSKGSGHNRGIAADLTLIHLTSGAELDMGTGFDNFTDTAHSDYTGLPEEVLQNRLLLKTTMEKHGFKVLSTEWWHYYYTGQSDFEILDIDFRKIKKLSGRH